MGGLPERIAVVGGGIGGLTFAAGLRHFLKDTVASSVSIKVYDQVILNLIYQSIHFSGVPIFSVPSLLQP